MGAQSPQGVPLLPTGSSEVDISFWLVQHHMGPTLPCTVPPGQGGWHSPYHCVSVIAHGLLTVTGSQGAGEPRQGNEKRPWTFSRVSQKETLPHGGSGGQAHIPLQQLSSPGEEQLPECQLRVKPTKSMERRHSLPKASLESRIRLLMAARLRRPRNPYSLGRSECISVPRN